MAMTALELVEQARAQIEIVTPERAFEEVGAGQAILLDVREPTEWEYLIDAAVHVPRGLLEFAADPNAPGHIAELDPARRVIVYCHSGVRSALAALTLKTLGYANVASLEGGISAWMRSGLPVVEHSTGA